MEFSRNLLVGDCIQEELVEVDVALGGRDCHHHVVLGLNASIADRVKVCLGLSSASSEEEKHGNGTKSEASEDTGNRNASNCSVGESSVLCLAFR